MPAKKGEKDSAGKSDPKKKGVNNEGGVEKKHPGPGRR